MISLALVVLVLGVLEGVLRLGPVSEPYQRVASAARGESSGQFEGAPHTIYRLAPGPGINSLGFADREWPVERRPGVPRIACLGASTTQDGLRAERPTYPRQLARLLQERLGCPEVETLNFGINGWTTAESLTNYFLNVVDYDPDLIVIQHALNDVWPRLWPDYVNDYSHYRVPYEEFRLGPLDAKLFLTSRLYAFFRLRSLGKQSLSDRNTVPLENRNQVLREAVLSPETTVGFRQNVQAIVDHATSRGIPVLLVTIKVAPNAEEFFLKNQPEIMEHLKVGTEQHNEILRDLASSGPAHLVDISRIWEEDDFATNHFPNYTDGFVHVNAKGNGAKALLIADAIEAAGLLEPCR